MALRTILLVIAIILFVLTAFGVGEFVGLSLAWIGAAFFAGSFLS